jgi:hypothetical protein
MTELRSHQFPGVSFAAVAVKFQLRAFHVVPSWESMWAVTTGPRY